MSDPERGLHPPTITEILTKTRPGQIAHPEGKTLGHAEAFEKALSKEFRLVDEEQLIYETWLSSGDWYVGVEAKLNGEVSAGLWSQALLTLKAEPSSAHPVQALQSVAPNGWEDMACEIKSARSEELIHVTLSGSATVCPSLLKYVKISCVP